MVALRVQWWWISLFLKNQLIQNEGSRLYLTLYKKQQTWNIFILDSVNIRWLTLWLPNKIFHNCHLVPNKCFRFSSMAPNNIFGFSLLASNKIDCLLFHRWPTVWFCFLKKVLVLCKRAVYLFVVENWILYNMVKIA